MKAIDKTIQTFETDKGTYYLDLLKNGKYMISKDERIKYITAKNDALKKFKDLSKKHNSKIETHK